MVHALTPKIALIDNATMHSRVRYRPPRRLRLPKSRPARPKPTMLASAHGRDAGRNDADPPELTGTLVLIVIATDADDPAGLISTVGLLNEHSAY